MHVTRVELENIKSFERGSFAFERGTTAIVGPNGAGKTTYFNLISGQLRASEGSVKLNGPVWSSATLR